ncbi:MAG: hypothetical protein Kow0065_04340 [Methylomicrobium sp.]
MNNKRFGPILLSILLFADSALAAKTGPVSIELDTPRAFGYSLGDTITLTAQIKVPLFYTLETGFLPQPGPVNEWLTIHTIEPITPAADKDYALAVTYQVFKSVRTTEELTIPPLPIRFLHRGETETESIPAWTFSYNPLIPATKADNRIAPEPELAPRPIDTNRHADNLSYLLSAIAALTLYIVWFYGKIPFLERYSGAFGVACRELRRLKKQPTSKENTLQALQCFHRALNEVAGETVFASELPAFFQREPKFRPLQEKTEALFDISQRWFFTDESPPIERAHIENLCRLYRKLERSPRWISA